MQNSPPECLCLLKPLQCSTVFSWKVSVKCSVMSFLCFSNESFNKKTQLTILGINFFRNYIFGIADVRDLLVCYLMAELAERESQNDRRLSRAAQLSGEGELQSRLCLLWRSMPLPALFCFSFSDFVRGMLVPFACGLSYLLRRALQWLFWLTVGWFGVTHEDTVLGMSVRAFPGEFGWEGKTYNRTSPDRKRPYPACLSSLLPKQSLIANSIFIWQQESRVGTAEASSFVDWVLCSPRM